MSFVFDELLHHNFISEVSYFWEVISSNILDLFDSTVKSNGRVLPGVIVEAYDFLVDLRRPDPQITSVYFSSSQNQGGSVSPVVLRFAVQDGV